MEDVDGLIETLKERVARRRVQGEYPPGLEEQLEAEFTLIMDAVHRPEVDTGDLGQQISNIREAIGALGAHPLPDSRVPGGKTIHKAGSRVVERHTSVLAEQVRCMGRDIADALNEVRRLVELQREADERQLHEMVSAVLDRVAVIDHLADAVIELERRVGELEVNAAIV